MSTGDSELDDLFAGDPELAETARRLRSSRPEPPLDPRFPIQLRSQLLAQATTQLARTSTTRWRWRTGLAWGVALAATGAAAAVLLVTTARTQPHDQVTFVTATSPLAEQHAVTGDVITVSFNQPMDHAAVIAGLRIRPATAVTTSWHGTQLLMAPLHHLTPNTPYTVTIDEGAARASSGRVIKGGVRITFGTAPLPTPPTGPAPSPPAPLGLTRLGPVADPSAVVVGSGGTLLASRGIAPQPAPPPITPGASPGVEPPASPSPRGHGPATDADSPEPTPAAVPAPGATAPAVTLAPLGPALTSFSPGGPGVRLADAASALALSPDGTRILAAVPRSDGTDVVAGQLGMSSLAVIAHTAGPASAVAWRPDGGALVATLGQIGTAGPNGRLQSVVPTALGAPVVLAPDGRHAAVGGRLVDLDTGGGRDLHEAQGPVAFSPGGATVAWFDGAAIDISPVGQDQPLRVELPGACASPPAELAVTDDRSWVACTATTGALVLVDATTGRPLATTNGAYHPAFSPAGDELGMVVTGGAPNTFSAAVALVPPAPTRRVGPTVPPAAAGLLDRLVEAQVRGDRQALMSLGGDPTLALRTPAGLTRGRVIETASLPGGVTALVRLMTDPTSERPGSATDETIVLIPGGPAGVAIGPVVVGPTHDELSGPHVVHVDEGGGDTPTSVGFDSDLAPATVPSAIAVLTADGSVVPVQVTYDADARTASVRLPAAVTGPLRLVVSATLADIAGQRLAQPFTAPIR